MYQTLLSEAYLRRVHIVGFQVLQVLQVHTGSYEILCVLGELYLDTR
jgi:hypothetical protein